MLLSGPGASRVPLPLAMIIAIDGPAAAGKSTIARRLAQELNLAFLDTGAMYRAVTRVALDRDVAPGDAAACARLAREIDLDFDAEGRLSIDGRSAEPGIRAAEVDACVSAVSAHPEVRRAIVPKQRVIASRRGVVAEGRDIGTVVFPRADHKFFLIASATERARRRAEQIGKPDEQAAIETALRRRDELDSTRADSPLVRAQDAELIDTDELSIEGVVAHILDRVRGAVS